jgi:hypothetical protein
VLAVAYIPVAQPIQREKYKLCKSPVNWHAVADEGMAAAVSLRCPFTVVSPLVMLFGQRQATTIVIASPGQPLTVARFFRCQAGATAW